MFSRKHSKAGKNGAAASASSAHGSNGTTNGIDAKNQTRTIHNEHNGSGGKNGEDIVVIGEGVDIKAEIWNCSRVVVSGNFDGALSATEVIVNETGRVNATVFAERADIGGLIDGKLVVMDRVDIRDGGCVSGGLVYGTLAIEPGGVLTGNLRRELDAEEQQALEGLKAGHSPAEIATHVVGSAGGYQATNGLNGSETTDAGRNGGSTQTWQRNLGGTS